jgi:hypothetical protein
MAARDRRRRRTGRIVGLVLLVLALAAAALFWPRPTKGALDVSSIAAVAPTGLLQGQMAAARSGDRVCYSIAAKGTTAVLRFVPGWSADALLGLRDPSGLVVAQPGDTLVILGAPASVGTVTGCPRRGRIWTVTSITRRTVR